MRRILLVGFLFMGAGLAGCQGVEGPFARARSDYRIDDPRRTIDEQEKIGRDRLALPERSDVAPRTFAEEPGLRGYR